jgi:E3 ubiquitin-protein ligase HUWE1
MLENDFTGVISETFSVEKDIFGETEVVDLIQDGSTIEVVNENKTEYVRLLVEYRLSLNIKDQLDMFLAGFHDIILLDLVNIYTDK